MVVVIAEIVFVLSNPVTYGIIRAALQDTVQPSLKLTNLKIERKQLDARIFDLFVSFPIDYVDPHHAILVEKAVEDRAFSYDRDF